MVMPEFDPSSFFCIGQEILSSREHTHTSIAVCIFCHLDPLPLHNGYRPEQLPFDEVLIFQALNPGVIMDQLGDLLFIIRICSLEYVQKSGFSKSEELFLQTMHW
ncbi:uncharacterized protein LOC113210985 [Frankliniella occidentalis]|uniref:Uncharacterized protein LOC113210985 n=1 Tax=Frankliniella occidentalis TaxID=133901 RepID=A0A6J1SVT3_FRAOC|nr:uncharacterized protein LOC113210985 [Frankliniella occidentalis]